MVRDTRLYDTLDVSPEASISEIKRAYRCMALKYHPDKNRHSEDAKAKFQEVSKAYEILADDEKRGMYDRYGTVDEYAVQEQQEAQGAGSSPAFFSSPMSPGDLFAQFFDNFPSHSAFRSPFAASAFGSSTFDNPGFGAGPRSSSPFQRSRTPSKGPDIKHNLKCTLEELYEGKITKLGLNRRRLCKSCRGQGSLKRRICKTCRGQGQQTETRRTGPMVQTWTQTCPDCGGTGTYSKQSDVCMDCRGECYVKERKIFDVEVQKGMCHGQTIVLPGEADEVIKTSHGAEKVIPGDVVITIDQSKNEKFHRVNRNGCDLLIGDCPIDLATSLCGGDIYIDGHPSGRVLKVSIIPGELIGPNCLKSIEGMGMPKYYGAGKGNLYVQFRVNYPAGLEPETVVKLQHVLSQDKNVQQQQQRQSEKVYEQLGDCAEMDEHVLSSFVPPLDEIASRTASTERDYVKRKWKKSGDGSGEKRRHTGLSSESD
ncbi:APJ1 (YNL077W) [Zygosaccharomyces parabailii]|nr:APJ1 (YNL077W) [Zygosaccharomyces parabailii]SJM87448.1 related to J domain-containing protein APJ1 [Zygosaccharomyces bailii]